MGSRKLARCLQVEFQLEMSDFNSLLVTSTPTHGVVRNDSYNLTAGLSIQRLHVSCETGELDVGLPLLSWPQTLGWFQVQAGNVMEHLKKTLGM